MSARKRPEELAARTGGKVLSQSEAEKLGTKVLLLGKSKQKSYPPNRVERALDVLGEDRHFRG